MYILKINHKEQTVNLTLKRKVQGNSKKAHQSAYLANYLSEDGNFYEKRMFTHLMNHREQNAILTSRLMVKVIVQMQ